MFKKNYKNNVKKLGDEFIYYGYLMLVKVSVFFIFLYCIMLYGILGS